MKMRLAGSTILCTLTLILTSGCWVEPKIAKSLEEMDNLERQYVSNPTDDSIVRKLEAYSTSEDRTIRSNALAILVRLDRRNPGRASEIAALLSRALSDKEQTV